MATDNNCCEEFEKTTDLSRRGFLQGLGAVAAATGAVSVFGTAVRQTSYAATSGGNVLVVLSLRGGIDGLGLVVPHGDPNYYRNRPNIGIPKRELIAKDNMFGLHPGMKPVQRWWNSGELAAIHAVGLPAPNRSHFSAMEEVEDAAPGSNLRQGWVNRMIGLNRGNKPTEAIHLGGSLAPTLVLGPQPSLSATELDQLTIAGAEPKHEAAQWANRRRQQLRTMWANDKSASGKAVRSALQTAKTFERGINNPTKPRNGAKYPNKWPAQDLSDALKDTARLIRMDVGAEVISIDFGSWDMHANYGNLDWGDMQAMVTGLAQNLNAFLTDLGPGLRKRVTLVTISEFGRRVEQNGNTSGGLDHGWGNMMLVAGAGVKGGRYHGSWPGLSGKSNTMADGDVPVTTDYRNVLAEIAARRFNRTPAKVFPGLKYKRPGIMK